MSINLQSRKDTGKQKLLTHTNSLSGFLKYRKKCNDNQKSRFYSDLFLLLSSGLDIITSIEIIEDQTPNQWIKNHIHSVKLQIISGKSLSLALKENNLADNYEYYSFQIGEECGEIIEVLNEINLFYMRKLRQRKQITRALTYPILVLLTAIIAVGFMLNVIVPMFIEVFKRFEGNLPELTLKIIHLSEFIKNYFFIIILFTIISIYIIIQINKTKWFRNISHNSVLMIPIIGRFVKIVQSARFCHAMSLMTKAHSPLIQSLILIEKMISFIPLNSAIISCIKDVKQGKSLHLSMRETGFFEKKFIALVKASEEVNQLGYAFNQLSIQYNEEIEFKLGMMGNLLEPLLIILVGGLVGIILIAMYLPLFQIGTSIF